MSSLIDEIIKQRLYSSNQYNSNDEFGLSDIISERMMNDRYKEPIDPYDIGIAHQPVDIGIGKALDSLATLVLNPKEYGYRDLPHFVTQQLWGDPESATNKAANWAINNISPPGVMLNASRKLIEEGIPKNINEIANQTQNMLDLVPGEALESAGAKIAASAMLGSGKWAKNMYNKLMIPEGWYVHGRAGQKTLDTENVIQLTKDWDIADYYAGKKGSKWMIKPNEKAKILDFSDDYNDDMDHIVSLAINDYKKNKLPFSDEIHLSTGKDKLDDDDIDSIIRSEFSPSNIVNSAGAFDNQVWVKWLQKRTKANFIITPDGAISLDKKHIKSIMVDE